MTLSRTIALAICFSSVLANSHIPRASRMIHKSKRLMPIITDSTVGSDTTSPAPISANVNVTANVGGDTSNVQAACFPSQSFQMPDDVPATTDGWWCDPSTEYAFVGFSYEVTACQSAKQLQKEFKDMKETFNSRYVRLYGACDKKGFYDDLVDAAWDNGLGIHALVWFGFDGGNQWKTRRDTLFQNLQSNPKAKFVTRAVQFGSEPLFDSVLSPSQLADQVKSAKKTLAPLGINVTVSDMAYGYQSHGGAQDVIDEVDFLNVHMLPYFNHQASTAKNSWPILMTDHQWFTKHGQGKKMYWSENGWPSMHYPGVQANSAAAVANVAQSQGYYQLLDSKCEEMKEMPGGGVAWFWHLYSDAQEPGYGLYDGSGKLKFPFKPKTSC